MSQSVQKQRTQGERRLAREEAERFKEQDELALIKLNAFLNATRPTKKAGQRFVSPP